LTGLILFNWDYVKSTTQLNIVSAYTKSIGDSKAFFIETMKGILVVEIKRGVIVLPIYVRVDDGPY